MRPDRVIRMWERFKRATPIVVILAAMLVPACIGGDDECRWMYAGLVGSIEYGETNVTNQEIYDFLVDHENITVTEVNGNAHSLPFYHISFEFDEWPGYENDYTFHINRYVGDEDVHVCFFYETEIFISEEKKDDVLDRVYDSFDNDNETAWGLMNAMVLEFNDLLDDEPGNLWLVIGLEETYDYD